jgi:hypothetical protein
MDEEAIGMVNWDRLAQLLKGPFGSGMGRDTHVKESTTRILNHHKDIEDLEGAGDCDTKVTGHKASRLIADKR